MTDYKVELTQTARRDLLGIVYYIQTELREPQIAKKLYWLLKEEINSLSYLPERNPLMDGTDEIRALELRKLLVKNYSVLYRVDNEVHTVRIARVMYSGRDIATQLTDTQWNEE